MTDFIYHHKTIILTVLIFMVGGFLGFVSLKKEVLEEQEFLTDAGSNLKENIIEEPKKDESIIPEKEEKIGWITVDIKGAVNLPNVYQMKEGSRIYEIIDLAGGLKDTATTKNINLSKKVEDEMVIYIFTEQEYLEKNNCSIKNDYKGEISEEIKEKESIITEKKEETENQKISLNRATLEELLELDGIGEAKAQSIIKYRSENGLFQQIEDVMNVPGIGESLYEKIKDKISI